MWLENDYLLLMGRDLSLGLMLLNGDPQNNSNSLLVEPFVWYFNGGILVQLGPFPGALPSNLRVLLKPNGIEFLAN